MQELPLQQLIRFEAAECGFHLAGIAPAQVDDLLHGNREDSAWPEATRLEQWIAEGRAGEMEYLKRRDAEGRLLRSSVQIPFAWARSIVVCAVNYNTDQPYSIEPLKPSDGPERKAWIARYAWSGSADPGDPQQLAATDYHHVIRTRLEVLLTRLRGRLGHFEARCFVDTGPIAERLYARYAGLGWQGKNTCLINQSLGSWFFLGVIITSLNLPVEQRAAPAADRCGSCTRCIDACPTAALEPYRMDASRCIAYLTIEKRGPLPEPLAAQTGRHVFGCDICQEVCPWNRRAPITDWPELQARTELVNPAIDWLEAISEQEFRDMFRNSPIERARFSGFARNVANARRNAPGLSGSFLAGSGSPGPTNSTDPVTFSAKTRKPG